MIQRSFYVKLITLLLTISLVHTAPCPHLDDKLLGSSCFEFVELPLTSFFSNSSTSLYDQAQAYCANRQKSLAIVRSPGEQYFLANTLRSLQWSEALVGLQYRRTAWTWASDGTYLRGQGCMLNSFDSATMAKLPNTYSDTMTMDRCVEFCAGHEHIFSAIQGGNYCYCANEFVWFQTSPNCSVPCAGRRDEHCGSAFSSALQFTAEDAYDNWEAGLPTTGGNCASIRIDGIVNPWVDTSCSAPLPFFCKFVETNAQPYGADRSTCSQNACYYYFSSPELSWQAADQFCIKSGGRLATIESEERQALVDGILSDPSVKAVQVWIGASSRDWYFPDDSSINLRQGWASANEPANQEVNSCADLVVAMSEDLIYGWRTRPCTVPVSTDSLVTRFICSAPAVDDQPSTVIHTNPPTTTTKTTTTTTNLPPTVSEASWLTTRPFLRLSPSLGKVGGESSSLSDTVKAFFSNINYKAGEDDKPAMVSDVFLPASMEPLEEEEEITVEPSLEETSTAKKEATTSPAKTKASKKTKEPTTSTGAITKTTPVASTEAATVGTTNTVPVIDANSDVDNMALPTMPSALSASDAARQIAQSDVDRFTSDRGYPATSSGDTVGNNLPWWSMLLIIIGTLILVALSILIGAYVFKKRPGRKTSGRISPLSDRPMMGRRNYASSRQSSARTTHGRSNQVLLY